jgi:hypothetical protein
VTIASLAGTRAPLGRTLRDCRVGGEVEDMLHSPWPPFPAFACVAGSQPMTTDPNRLAGTALSAPCGQPPRPPQPLSLPRRSPPVSRCWRPAKQWVSSSTVLRPATSPDAIRAMRPATPLEVRRLPRRLHPINPATVEYGPSPSPGRSCMQRKSLVQIEHGASDLSHSQ